MNLPSGSSGCRYEIDGVNAGRKEVVPSLQYGRVLAVHGRLVIVQKLDGAPVISGQLDVLDQVLTEIRFVPSTVKPPSAQKRSF